ncbi:MAG: hypothetical protein Q7S04_00120 [Candidatus Moranbacteria bacterium]|nr:hypothetical protein [Candidatus Moranbacteria bacterium]
MRSNHFHLKFIAVATLFLFVGIFPIRQTHAAADGTLFGWGMNFYGNLGLGWASHGYSNALGFSRDYVLSPTQVGMATNWASISAGNFFVMATKADGTLWGWGNNSSGQLGLGYISNPPYSWDSGYSTGIWSPTQVGSGTNWANVAAGDSFVLAVKTDGTLWAWGGNPDGQLGLGDTISRSVPTRVGTDTNWSGAVGKISGGYANSAAVKTDGTIWVWGSDVFGELGQGNTNGAISRYYPTQVGTATNWDKVSAMGQFTVLATKTDGTLWAWGDNMYGQVGPGYVDYSGNGQHSVPAQVGTGTNWSSIGQGDTYSMALKRDGTMWVWGRVSIPFAVNCDVSGCYGMTGSPTQVGTATDWRSFGAYPYPTSVAAIKTDGTLWDWGNNWYGNLGLGDTVTRNSQTQVGTGTNWDSVTSGIYGTMAITGTPPPPTTLKACVSSCTTTGASAITNLTMAYNSTSTIAACYNTAAACDAPDNTGNVTLSSAWAESGTDVVSLSDQSNSTKKFQSGTAYGTETITITYLTQSVTLNVTVPCIETMTCAAEQTKVCSDKTVPTGKTLSGICGTVDCGGKPGKRYCDFNWKEVAP